MRHHQHSRLREPGGSQLLSAAPAGGSRSLAFGARLVWLAGALGVLLPGPTLAEVASGAIPPSVVTAEAPADSKRAVGTAPWSSDERRILAALREGQVVSMKSIGRGVTKPKLVQLEHEGLRIRSVWKPIVDSHFEAAESHEAEVAAYRLSRWLGIDMVPPTVRRRIGRHWGSLQFWVEDHQMFADVLDSRPAGFIGSNMFQIMRFFDTLIDNPDRNAGNFLVDDAWRIVLIDHSRALHFGSGGSEREGAMPHRFERRVVSRLRRLDAGALEALLGDLYTRGEIRRLLRSAKSLLDFVDREVELHGAEVAYFERQPPHAPPRGESGCSLESLWH